MGLWANQTDKQKDRRKENQRLEQSKPPVSIFKNDNFCVGVIVQSLRHVQLFATPMDCSMPGFPVLHHLLEPASLHW